MKDLNSDTLMVLARETCAAPTHQLLLHPVTAARLTMLWHDAQVPDEFHIPSPWKDGGRISHDGDVCEVKITEWAKDGMVYKWAIDFEATGTVTF